MQSPQHHQSPSFERNAQPSDIAEAARQRFLTIDRAVANATRGLLTQYGAELTAQPAASQAAEPAVPTVGYQDPLQAAVNSEQMDIDAPLDAGDIRSMIDQIHAEMMREDGRDAA